MELFIIIFPNVRTVNNTHVNLNPYHLDAYPRNKLLYIL